MERIWKRIYIHICIWGFPGGTVVKNPPANIAPGELISIPGSGRSPGGGKWPPTPVLLPGEPHRQRSPAGHSPWGHRVGHDWVSTHSAPTHTHLKQNHCCFREMKMESCSGFRSRRAGLWLMSGLPGLHACSQTHQLSSASQTALSLREGVGLGIFSSPWRPVQPPGSRKKLTRWNKQPCKG